MKTLNEENGNSKKVIEKYKSLYAELQEQLSRKEAHYQNTAVADDNKVSAEYYQNYNNIIQQKHDLLREKMNIKLRAKQRNMSAIKLFVYMDSLPESMQILLKMDQFDTFFKVFFHSKQLIFFQLIFAE